MPTNKDYAYGSTGTTLTPEQLIGLANATKLVRNGDPLAAGTGKPIYDFVLGLLSHVETIYDLNGIPVQTTVINSNVDPAVFDWVFAPRQINGASSSAGALIAGYTSNAYRIRTGKPLDLSSLYEASNNIAVSLANGIEFTKGIIPGIVGLGAVDAG